MTGDHGHLIIAQSNLVARVDGGKDDSGIGTGMPKELGAVGELSASSDSTQGAMNTLASGSIRQDPPVSGGNWSETEGAKPLMVEVKDTRSGITAPPGCTYSARTVYVPKGMLSIALLAQLPAIALKGLPALPSISGPLGTKFTRT